MKQVASSSHKTILVENILVKLISTTASELANEVPNANKQTVNDIVKKCQLFRRLVYTMNKHEEAAREVVECHGSVDGLIL